MHLNSLVYFNWIQNESRELNRNVRVHDALLYIYDMIYFCMNGILYSLLTSCNIQSGEAWISSEVLDWITGMTLGKIHGTISCNACVDQIAVLWDMEKMWLVTSQRPWDATLQSMELLICLRRFYHFLIKINTVFLSLLWGRKERNWVEIIN